jgi:peptidoglycan hydrolase-like protein with peptidoglycan-binding domain
MGLLTNNKPNVDAIKKFQTANGLTADGIIGPNTAGAILSAQKPGGPAANLRGPASAQERSSYAKAPPANMTGQAATPTKPAAPANPTNQSVSQRMATQPSVIDQGRAKLGIPAGGTAPAKLQESTSKQSSFEYSVDQMRRMSTMLKG